MNTLKQIRTYLLVCGIALLVQPIQARAQQNAAASGGNAKTASLQSDGQHDFDFEFGTWKSHVKRLVNPLSGSSTWTEYEGVTVVRKIWNGRANVAELEADGPAGHLEALSLRLYNPESHQWSLNYANSKIGVINPPPTVGEFRNGRAEFYDMEPINGRYVLVRNIWDNITPNSCRFEQAFSVDAGKTWEVNWIATDTRVNDDSAKSIQPASTSDEQHDWDFEIGSWNIHLSRLKDRLAGSTTWVRFEGTSVTRKLWNGHANLEEFETDNQTDHIEGMTLRLYNPRSHQWSIYWATSKDGILGQPMIGEFKNGQGEFFDQEFWKGKAVFVRFIWSKLNTNSPHFEQSFSDDGGKTWEVNWITDQVRAEGEPGKGH
jgi:hypothetical protein